MVEDTPAGPPHADATVVPPAGSAPAATTTHPPAAERLAAMVAEWETTGDRRAIFAEAYGLMTARMGQAIEAQEFGDGVWVGRLLEGFADYYFVACDDHRSGAGTCPEVWRGAFDACADGRHHPLQLLLLGMNAHINHDLVFALADVLDDWDDLSPRTRELRRADHTAVNVVIARTVDEVQDEVVARWSPMMGQLDRALGPVDEWFLGRLVSEWREDVWDMTQRLLMPDGEDAQAIQHAIHERTQRTARLILVL